MKEGLNCDDEDERTIEFIELILAFYGDPDLKRLEDLKKQLRREEDAKKNKN